MAVKFVDNSITVKAQLTQASIRALKEAGFEVAAHANRNIQSKWEARDALRGSYRSVVDEAAGVCHVGTDREEGYWEEYGTGSHADMAKNGGKPGRTDWWVFVPYETPRALLHEIHRTEAQAKAEASSRRENGEDAYASDGEEPHYTLENAFIQTKPAVIAEFERLIREGLA